MDYNSIYIDGEIVKSTDAGTVWPCTTAAYVRDALSWVDLSAIGTEGLVVYINSPGGSYTEGMAIYDMLLATGLKITTVAVGECSSMASLIFMAGTTRRAMRNTTFHPHCPFGGVDGTADAIAAYAADLAEKQGTMAAIYAARCAKTPDEVLAMLKLDKDMTADEALAYGLATEVVQPASAVAYTDRKPARAGADTTGSPTPTARPGVRPRTRMAGKATTTKPGDKAARLIAGLGRFAQDIRALISGDEVKAKTVKTTGDTPLELNISTDDTGVIQPGDPVVTSAGDPVADGAYTLEDGTAITVVGGFIDTVTPPADGKKEGETTATTAGETTTTTTTETSTTGEDFKAKYEAEKKRADDLEARTSATAKRVEQLAAMITTGGTAPAVDAVENQTTTTNTQRQDAKASTDANSAEQKEAAAKRIADRNAAKAKARGGRR